MTDPELLKAVVIAMCDTVTVHGKPPLIFEFDAEAFLAAARARGVVMLTPDEAGKVRAALESFKELANKYGIQPDNYEAHEALTILTPAPDEGKPS